jgi:large subunit ribosomal protein L22
MATETNTFAASHRFARISAQKARLVIDLIRGDGVGEALTKLRFSHRRASPMIRKVLRSALANATQKAGLSEEELVVWRAFVDGGPMFKRIRPRAQGRAYQRLSRSCHINIVLKQMDKAAGSSRKKGKAAGKPQQKPTEPSEKGESS